MYETIVVVEDDALVRRSIVAILQDEGYSVFEADCGTRGLILADELGDRIDLVVSDVCMPDMDGREMVRRLRERHPDVRILYVSGSVCDDDVGSDASLLAKPFGPEQLVEAIERRLAEA